MLNALVTRWGSCFGDIRWDHSKGVLSFHEEERKEIKALRSSASNVSDDFKDMEWVKDHIRT